MPQSKFRNIGISCFVVVWLFAFHYESTRFFYLNPLIGRELPKIKFLFPPAGWIMFFHVDEQFGFAEVYGVKDGQTQRLDPHQILPTRPIGYDNIQRNVLTSVLDAQMTRPFCGYLQRKFSYFDGFLVTYVLYPSVIKAPFERYQKVMYQCP